LAILLVEWKLQTPLEENSLNTSAGLKLKRIDWIGAITLSLSTLSALVAIDIAGQKHGVSDPSILYMAVIAVVSGLTFLIVEKYYAKEPIFPLHLISHYTVITSYAIIFCQNFSQTAVSNLGISSSKQIFCVVSIYCDI
jgi:hypothetical protein